MVFADFDDFEDQYSRIRQVACGRLACSVMIIVALEVDALATANMLCQLLRGDNIAYSVRPVSNLDQILKTYKEHMTSDIRTIFMINCGAIHDIPKLFDLETGGDVRCFVLDHHRPIHLKNCYSKYNVVVFGSEMDVDDIPSDGSEMSFNESDNSSVQSNENGSANSEDDSEAGGEENDEADEYREDAEGEAEEVEGEDAAEEEGEEELFAAPKEDREDPASADAEQNEEDQEEQEEEGSRSGESEASASLTYSAGETGEASNPRGNPQSTALPNFDNAPAFDYGHGEDEEEDEGEDDDEDKDTESLQPIVGKRRKVPSEVQTRRAKRQRILRYYRRPPSHAPPTAIVIMPFIKAQLSGNGVEPVDVMWQAILGLTDHFLRGTIGEKYYNACCHLLKVELGEHLTSSNQISIPLGPTSENGLPETVTVSGSAAGNIVESLDYRFFLYRHWSLYESMCHSSCIASRFPVWKSDGLKKLQVMLAEIGVSLQQCTQSYPFMDPQCRNLFDNELRRNASLRRKYNLNLESLTFKSFCRHVDYKYPVSASDTVLTASALLEHTPETSSATSSALGASHPPSGQGAEAQNGENKHYDRFFQAWKLLTTHTSKSYRMPVDIAIGIQQAIVKQASALLDGQDLIHRYHRIYYAFIRTSKVASLPSLAQESVFCRPSVLARLGQFLMHIKRELPRKNGGWRGSNLLPLILLSEVEDGVLIIGISPLLQLPESSDTQDMEHLGRLLPLTNFLQFFQLAAKDLHISIKFDSFDSNCVKVAKDDAQDFLGALDNAMRKATPNFSSKTVST